MTAAAAPRATQRLQLHKDFPFDAVLEQLPYFQRLGISHLYASPILTARAGSMHCYDVVDHSAVNPELGGEEGLRRLVQGLRDRGMGLIVDTVPNHMAVGNRDNAWWMDVLQWGRRSRYAGFFDIDWDVPDPALHGKLLAPFLGKPYGEALADGEISLAFDGKSGIFRAQYYDHHFPIAPESYGPLLRLGGETLSGLAQGFLRFAGGQGVRQQNFAGACLGLALAALREDVAQALRRVLDLHASAQPEGLQRLHRLLEQQHFRLTWWRTAADEINWRRFFDVIDLAALRTQEHAVFEAVHGTLFRLYAEGLIDGFRVDHVDGLADPRQYCRRLRQRLHTLAHQRPPEVPPGPAYLVVEKILAPREVLALDWQTDGTSGYVFMNQAGALLHDPEGEAPLRALWRRRSGRSGEFAEEERQARRRIPQDLLAADFNACAHALHQLARADPRSRDWSLGAIKRVLAELLVHFPVYRTYADARGRSAADAKIMVQVCAEARRSCRAGEAPLVDLLDDWLGGTPPRLSPPPQRRARLRAIGRFQQLTSPVAAKSVEDTAFYRHGTLLSRNEVGADPDRFSLSVAQFHQACAERRERYPAAMLATATHDHKRGEDLRARLAVISGMPQRWAEAADRFSAAAAPLKPRIEGIAGPDATDEYMLHQMLVGAWPLDFDWRDAAQRDSLRERLAAWQRKAVREAKRRSGWVEPNLPYEEACDTFLRRLLDGHSAPSLLEDVSAFVGGIAAAGALNGLSQTLLRLTTPGVPDLYQGCEWWDFSLVDPDNRRPVDYAARARALQAADTGALARWRDGRVKQQLIARLLDFRARKPQLFTEGDYLPLRIEGPAAEQAIAFARVLGAEALLVLAPLRPLQLLAGTDTLEPATGAWRDSVLLLPDPIAAWPFHSLLDGADAINGARLPLRSLLRGWPLAAYASS